MAQAGYTPIQLYYSSTTTNAPTAGNLASGELAINITDGKLFYKDNGGSVQVIAWKTTPTTAGGTGLTSWTAGDLPYYATGTTLSKLGIGTNGQILTSTGTAPQWSTLSGVAVTTFSAGTTGFTPSSATSGAITLAGTLATTNGGTGLTSFTANGVVYASSTSALTTGSALTFDGTNLGLQSATNAYAGSRNGATFRANSANGFEFILQSTNATAGTSTGFATAVTGNDIYFVNRLDGFYSWITGASGNTEQMRLTSTGLGIGTSSPSSRLVVSQGSGAFQAVQIVSSNPAEDAGLRFQGGGGNAFRIQQPSGARGLFFYDETATTTRMTIDASGNVGIGTSSPAGKLTVFNNVTGSPPVQYLIGDDFIGDIRFARQATIASFPNSYAMIRGLYGSGDARRTILTFWTSDTGSSTEQMRLDSSGNLGLGVTPSAWGTSGTVLKAFQVGQASSFAAHAAANNFYTNNNAYYDGTNWRYINSSTASGFWGLGSEFRWMQAASGTAGNTISFTQAMTLDASGDLGVGTTNPTSYSSKTIQLNGSSTSAAIKLTNSTTGEGDGAGFDLELNGSDINYVNRTASGVQKFWTNSTERARITSGGDLIVGATSSAAGKFIVKDNSSGNNIWLIGRSSDGTSSISFRNNADTAYNARIECFDTGVLTFGTGTSATERFRIASNGAWGLAGANYGTSGQVLTSNGSGSAPSWQTVGGGSAATPTALGTVYGLTSAASPNSTFLGYQAGNSTTAPNNTAVGYQALDANTTGDNNHAFGINALGACTTGRLNVAIGGGAGSALTTGTRNIFVGVDVAAANTTGEGNVAIGTYGVGTGTNTFAANTTGSNNIAIGGESLRSNTTASDNIAIGANALSLNTTGTANVAVGRSALTANTTASNSTAVGYQALFSSTTASNNVAVGYQAANINTTGTSNVVLGAQAFYSNTTGSFNTALGRQALFTSTTAPHNTAVGYASLYYNTTGQENVSVGSSALESNTTGSSNVAVGRQALYLNTTAVSNTAVGHQAAYSNTTGYSNAAVGRGALYANTTGYSTVAVGSYALEAQTTGFYNTAIGHVAGDKLTTGAYNVIIGAEAARSAGSNLTTGQYNTIIGCYSGTSNSNGQKQIVIGYNVAGQADANVTIGSSSGKIYNAFESNATWTQTSDGTMKNVVGPDTLGLSFINRLNPIKFTWKAQNELPTNHPYYNEVNSKDTTTVIHGFVAQEVKAALDAEGCTTFNGWDQGPDGIQAISREMFISPLVKAVQELSAQVEQLKAELATLKGN